MKKRGVSPVVATVLLVAIVVVIAVIIFLWAQSFLSESAQKGDRAVEISCGKVNFESQIVLDDQSKCGSVSGGSSSLDINNIGNVPIYGLRVLEWNEALGSLVVEEILADGTITIGKSATVCLGKDVMDQEAFRVVPKLLAEDSDGRKTVYTCPEKDGSTIAFTF